MKHEFHIPATWDNKALDRILAACSNENMVTEIYGSLRGFFPTGRPNDNAYISKENLISHFRYAKSRNIKTNYLLNGIISAEHHSIESTCRSYFRWLFDHVKPDLVTVSNKHLIEHLIKNYDCKQIKISIMAGVKTNEDLDSYFIKDYIGERIMGVVFHHDITELRDSHLVRRALFLGAEPSVLINESCYQACPYRQKHYELVSNAVFAPQDTFFDYFQADCIAKRLCDPSSLLDLVGFILPETIHEFERATGIKSFKIAGRARSNQWIIETTSNYVRHRSSENVFDSIVFTAPLLYEKFKMTIGDLFFLRAKAYLPILRGLYKINDVDKRRTFREKMAVQLFEQGDLSVRDIGSEYAIKGNKIALLREGEYLHFLKAQCRLTV